MIKTNHSGVEGRSSKMSQRIFLNLFAVCILVSLTSGLDFKRRNLERNLNEQPTAEDCMQPPMTKRGHECCRLPKERIWGDLRPSFSLCFRKLRDEKTMQQEMTEDGDIPEPTDVTESPNKRGGRPRGKKPHHLRPYSNDSCFMECVFEDQGFLTDKMLNKEALLQRLNFTLRRNEPWHRAATGALETCYRTVVSLSSNATCQSGSEEVFRCILKEIFFNCPRWNPSNYCTSLREFYQKCPNGPPPVINDNHSTPIPTPTTSAAPSMEELEPESNSEENQTEPNPTTETETVTVSE